MHELFEKMRNHRVNIDGNVSTVMFTTLVLEVSLVFIFVFLDEFSSYLKQDLRFELLLGLATEAGSGI